MPTRTEYDRTLDRLAALLRRKPLTARGIAKAMDCCHPVAYQRLRALEARGEAVYVLPYRESKTGPGSLAYGIR